MNKHDKYALLIGIPLLFTGIALMLKQRKNQVFVDWLTRFESGLNVALSFNQQRSLHAIINAFRKYGDGDENKLAYILATAWHESRMEPVRECFAQTDAAARQCVQGSSYGHEINGQVYYGRGLVQLTWLSNYEKMSDFLGIDLVNAPDLALEPKRAAEILVYGMMNGSFTGKRLSQYINSSTTNFYDARRVVNGTDKANLIAEYAIGIADNFYLA